MPLRIVLSSGHGAKISGAVDIIDEHDEAVRVVDRTAEFFRRAGVECTTYEDTVSTTQDENLRRIVDFHNAQGPHDWDISVHFNSSNGTTSKPIGTEVFHYSEHDVAAEVSRAIADAGDLIDRGAKDGKGLYFCAHTAEKALLLEICFVNSQADCDLYKQNFDGICLAIAESISGEAIDDQPPLPERPPATEGVLFQATGRCSWFGGPDDTGVSASEGLAFLYDYDDAPHLFLPEQPAGTSGLARRLNPGVMYIACRWDYSVTSKDTLARPSVQALVRAHGKEALAWPADWGPHESTHRVADLSPALMELLELGTDDTVEVIYPAP